MDKLWTALADFLRRESTGGLYLMAAAALALILANGPLWPSYQWAFGGPALLVIDDGLMVLFFLLVSLEIKRELVGGELSHPAQAALPAIAAVGGMVVPALIYGAINFGHGDGLRGWAIPSATDIAFSLAVLTLLGRHAPEPLKIFLTALAILDDLGAIIIIALFYTQDLAFGALALAGLGVAALVALNRGNVTRLWPYLLVGLWLWIWLLQSGVHATLAGVAVGLAIPAGDEDGPLCRLEHWLNPWVGFLILPLFAFAHAGLRFDGMPASLFLAPVPLGIALGLLIGKQAGVFGLSWAAIRLGWAKRPDGVSWRQFHGAAVLTGIGFTMSLFIGALAFPDGGQDDAVRLGVLAGSVASAVLGAFCLRTAR